MFNLKVYTENATLTEYRKRPKQLSDVLPWALLIKDGLGITKYGSFFQVIEYRGPDLDSSTRGELVAIRAQLNNVLRRLGSGWCLHFEAQRKPAFYYPDGNFADPVSAMVDQERRIALRDRKTKSFETRYFMTITYFPPEDSISKVESLLYENVQKGSLEEAYQQQLKYFEQTVSSILNTMKVTMPEVWPLGNDEVYTYLHSCISDNPHPVQAPDTPIYIDSMITDTPFTGGLAPMLGKKQLAVIGIKSYPGRSYPLLLEQLNELPFEFRWSCRFMPLNKSDAEKMFKAIKRKWFAKRKGIMTLLRESMVREESRLEDTSAVNKSEDADMALQALGDDAVSFGFFTPVFIIDDEDTNKLRIKTDLVKGILDGSGLVSVVEDTNAVDAWLGTMPGHPYANCRRPPVSSLNFIDMMPLAGVWAGDRYNKHYSEIDGKNVPAMLLAQTAGSTPFSFNLHHEGVGHTSVCGPTGSGKSAFLSFMAMQFRRYKNGRVIIFDREGSARCATHLVGGQFFPIGSDNSGLSFQPLAEIDDQTERTWATDWIVDLCESNNIVVTPVHKQKIWDALTIQSNQPVASRTLTVFRSLVQDSEIRNVLTMFIRGEGAHGDLLDADKAVEGNADWQCYETEALFRRSQAIGPVLSYLFHRIDRQFDGRPTLLIIDEAWAALDQPQFRAKLDDWLRTLRRRNVAVIFANQDLEKIKTSPIAPTLIQSCSTRIYLSNPRARDADTKPIYKLFGLNDRQIQLISQMQKRREYYYESVSGNRRFELGLSPLAVAVCASSSRNDLNKMDEIITQYGLDQFAEKWFDYKRIDKAYIQRLYHDLKIKDGLAQTIEDDGGADIKIIDSDTDEESSIFKSMENVLA